MPGSGHFTAFKERKAAQLHLSGHSGEKRFMEQAKNWDEAGGMVRSREGEGLTMGMS